MARVGDSANPAGRGSNNDGAVGGFNYANRLGRFGEATGIGFQGGASYGVYDWNGRPTNTGVLTTTAAQQQTFLTLGFYKRANERNAFSWGVVHDWMFNQGFGSQAVNPTLGQWRGQVAYATSAWNEFGVWATLRDKGATSTTSTGGLFSTRSINQANLFWHHKYDFGADSWLWVGIPQDSRLNSVLGGNLGDFLVGGSVIAPHERLRLALQQLPVHAPQLRLGQRRPGRSLVVHRLRLAVLPQRCGVQPDRGRQLLGAADARGQQRQFPGRQLAALEFGFWLVRPC